MLLLHDQCGQVFELTAINGTNYETRHSSSVHTVRGDSLMFSLAPAVASGFACCEHTPCHSSVIYHTRVEFLIRGEGLCWLPSLRVNAPPMIHRWRRPSGPRTRRYLDAAHTAWCFLYAYIESCNMIGVIGNRLSSLTFVLDRRRHRTAAASVVAILSLSDHWGRSSSSSTPAVQLRNVHRCESSVLAVQVWNTPELYVP